MKIKKILLIIIILLSAFLRLWNLSVFPSGLNADEAAIGYNVYSLIETGKDEHGQPWPVHFKSFADYKPGLYFYLVLPFVKILGLNVWAVRLPSAILGILSVYLIYLLVKKLFGNEDLGLLSAFFLAVSSWHLHFSRGGWESNAANFFILLGVWLFLKGLDKKVWFLPSILAFVCSLYTYHSSRIVVPLLVLGLIIIYRQKIFKMDNFKWIIFTIVVGLFALIPLIKDFAGPAGFSRFSGVGLLADSGPYWRINELRGQHTDPWSLPVKLVHNRLFGYGTAFLENWLSHFNGNFLFITGDVIERNRVPEAGQMYFFDIIFLAIGFYFFILKRPKNWLVVFLWLLIAPIAAALTFQAPHALRANNMVFPLVIIAAYGAYWFLNWLKKMKVKLLKVLILILVILLMGWNISRYLHQYYVHYPKVYPAAWEYGFEQLVDEVKDLAGNYDQVYVTDRYDQPYILFLFYLKYPPVDFQKQVELTARDQFGFSTVRDFDNFHFEAIDWDKLKTRSNILVVATPEEINESATILKRIYFPNGQVAFLIIQV